ncbi:MAG: cadherin-like beta sandwich domain-containing protein [Planctomycetota bacterium]|nr:cadherin-like beta sandwich domain-containing protein [Planctomycetota bacterium]
MKHFRTAFLLLTTTMVTTLLLGGCTRGSIDLPSTTPDLEHLGLSAGELSPAFEAKSTYYTANVGFLGNSINITPIPVNPGATVTINGTPNDSGIVFLEEGVNTITITVTAEDGVTQKSYILEVRRQPLIAFAQQAYIKASNTESGDLFGYKVALSGDTLAVAAHYENSSATGIDGDSSNNSTPTSGAVYVFTRNGNSWNQEAYLKASNTDAGDRFGYSLALSGDTLAVGTEYEDSSATGINADELDNNAPQSGAVYVFSRTGTTRTQEAYIKASNTGTGDRFGCDVALEGDTLAVGARYEDSLAINLGGGPANNDASNSGAVYLFTRTENSWTEVAYIKSSNARSGDYFGTNISLSGDTLVAGAWCEDSIANQSGAVYVFTYDGTSWIEEAMLKASNCDDSDFFGITVALSGDTLAVGATGESSGATGIGGNESYNYCGGSGAVYLFTRIANTWTQTDYVKASNTDGGDFFGKSLALSGDTLVVGAEYEDSNAIGIGGVGSNNASSGSGAVYLFTRSGGSWSQSAYIKASNSEWNDRFGTSVAVEGETVVVGAYFEESGSTGIGGNQTDNSEPNSGAVYVFE